jgi:hypothetical protein
MSYVEFRSRNVGEFRLDISVDKAPVVELKALDEQKGYQGKECRS